MYSMNVVTSDGIDESDFIRMYGVDLVSFECIGKSDFI